MSRAPSCTLAIAAFTLLASIVQAHEFWVMPSSFVLAPNSPVRLQLFNGERFRGDPVPRREASIERFELVTVGETERLTVQGADGGPFGFVRTGGPGPATIVYESVEQQSVLPADRFEAYLAEEKLTEAIASRKEMAETDHPGREVYVRCAKALITVRPDTESGEGIMPLTDTPVGLPLEIIFAPELSKTEGQVCARVLFRGSPISGVRVVCVDSDAPDALLEARTDPSGVVRFTAKHTGATMLTALHIERTPDRVDVDWKSYWASLTKRTVQN